MPGTNRIIARSRRCCPVYNRNMNNSSDVHESALLSRTATAALRRQLLAESSVAALAETFKLLGDATRVRILDALSRAELCVCDLARLLELNESAVSHQLRLLLGMRVVKARRDGRHIYYTMDDAHIVGLFEQGLEHVEERRA